MDPLIANARPATVDPLYASGHYFADPQRHEEDAKLKAQSMLGLYERLRSRHDLAITSYVDVGCGAGAAAKVISEHFTASGMPLTSVKGYDVSPHVAQLRNPPVEFVYGDFCRSDDTADLVTLFDVFEHVPNPLGFLQDVASRCEILGLHVPLENSIHVNLRGFNAKLSDPGHLMFLDVAQALNLLALAGLRVIDYTYTLGFTVNASHKSVASKVLFPFRWALARVSPWLLAKTLGGASMTVIALTPTGIGRYRPA